MCKRCYFSANSDCWQIGEFQFSDRSNKSVIAESLAKRLNLFADASDANNPLTILGYGGHSTSVPSIISNVKILSTSTAFAIQLSVNVVPNPTGGLQHTDWNVYKTNWDHLKTLDFPEGPSDNKTVELLMQFFSEQAERTDGDGQWVFWR